MTGAVSNIQRSSVSDGPGVRTTVFLSGCPLNCGWCHNPETRGIRPAAVTGPAPASFPPPAKHTLNAGSTPSAPHLSLASHIPPANRAGVLLFFENRCVGCGACAAACPKGVHVISDGRRSLNRSLCDGCGECARICPADAIDLRGAVMDVAGVMDIVRRDMPFYAATGGGVTISGGEPLYQFDFTRELLVAARNEGVHTCLDTSGWGGRAAELVSLVDIFLWDIKETDAIRHRAHTGAELDDIVDSLRAVDAAGGIIRLRCPLIPGVNARPEHMRSVGRLANSLKGVVGVDLIAYHELGAGKQSAMGETPARFGRLSDAEKDALFSALSESTPVQAGWHI